MPFTSNFPDWLRGVRVLDFTAVLAGPHLTRVLAQAGADVVKVESTSGGDTTRGLPFRFGDGQSGYFKQQNLGKQSVAIDLATPEGHKLALQLAARADIVVENFRPGVVVRLGISYEDVRAVRRNVIYVSISGWGQTGPYANMTGEVRSTTALSGLMAPDHEGRAPAWERCSFGDTNASIHGIAAIGAALHRVRSGGAGAYIDISILEGLIATNCLEFPEVLAGAGGLDGRESRTGGDHARVASGAFATANGEWVYARAVSPADWARLARLLQLEDLAYLTMPERRQLASAIYDALAAFCRARPSAANLLAEFSATGISCAPVRSVKDAIADPRTAAVGLVGEVDDASVGSVRVPTGLFATTAFRRAPQRPEPLLGQHGRAVLTQDLGYSDDEVTRLVAAGVILEHPGAGAPP